MLKYNFKYELKQLLRNRWIQLLSVLLLLLFGFATYNGLQKIEEREKVITAAKEETLRNDESMVMLLDSLDRGMEISVSPWRYPNNPMVVGNYYPRLAAMPSHNFTFIATGQSDMYSHYKKPAVSRSGFMEDYTEMTSPIQLLFGSFDLAFVIVYLLPLLIIAFSYDILSAEKESGSLRLLAAQPIRIENWVLQKLGLRFFWLSVLVILAMLVIFFIFGLNPFVSIKLLLGLIGITIVYMLFWFAVAFLVNVWVGSSARNAVSLLGFWIFFVLLIPSVLNQLGSSLYPMPSRALMINQIRTLQADATKRQDEILDNYLRDHPEYAINDSTQQRTFWHSYFASENLVRQELAPVLENYDLQLEKQQEWISYFKWISPAIITQESITKMAGTSTSDYGNFRKQVEGFSETWRNHFVPYLYNNRNFTKADVVKLPQFEYMALRPKFLSAFTILGIAVIFLALGLFIAIKNRNHLVLSNA
ncbi:DUF3526 domain-containing protein [Aequorivita echinoideorum]|uniref:ABC transporter permease n=1 Tax=Aequorivita echinoideorum TaxID=1549647 RepID=A0ABS5S2E3_9FLAO|nr:DUF3526 domain-containing protein [Aequorivita echinoideorum]MBT0607371.1 ABC transporter permease [Aequorivita echinoideorum]